MNASSKKAYLFPRKSLPALTAGVVALCAHPGARSAPASGGGCPRSWVVLILRTSLRIPQSVAWRRLIRVRSTFWHVSYYMGCPKGTSFYTLRGLWSCGPPSSAFLASRVVRCAPTSISRVKIKIESVGLCGRLRRSSRNQLHRLLPGPRAPCAGSPQVTSDPRYPPKGVSTNNFLFFSLNEATALEKSGWVQVAPPS